MHPRPPITANLIRVGMVLLALLAFGCRSVAQRSTAIFPSNHKLAAVLPPVLEPERHREELKFLENLTRKSDEPAIKDLIARLRSAEEARHRLDSHCVGIYADVALACWPLLPSSDESQSTRVTFNSDDLETPIPESTENVPWVLYHHSVELLSQEAKRFGLLDPQRGISIVDADGNKRFIEITRQGFPWKPEDFNQLYVVRSPLHSHLKRYWSDPGLGVPMVALRQHEESAPYLDNIIPYAATAVLRPAEQNDASPIRQAGYDNPSPLAVLELHDPLRVSQLADSSRQWDLARDLSAPLGFAQSNLNRDNLKSFLNPSREDEFAGLRMLEPYQPGKIPIVFVHGLLSDRVTWIDLINDLRNSRWISDHYQIWLYQYPTGQPFVISAAEMRSTLQQAMKEINPQGNDSALSKMVLIGHSMGGLVSKLLITDSQTALWDSVATRPIEDVKIAAEKRERVEAIFFFEPLPFVKRVIFIGTPHQGSKLATSWVGVLGSKLVHGSRERNKTTKTILHDNPGVFTDLERQLPTSVDLLRPDNPILLAAYDLPVNPEVKLHTVIGTGHPFHDGTEADGVVPVESARHPGTVSEKLIETSHTGLPDHSETTTEVIRILTEHASMGMSVSNGTPDSQQLPSLSY